MDSRGSREIVKGNRFHATGESQLLVLDDAGHQLFMGNPTGFIQLISDDLLGRVTGRWELKKYTSNYVDENGELMYTDLEGGVYESWRVEGKRQRALLAENAQ